MKVSLVRDLKIMDALENSAPDMEFGLVGPAAVASPTVAHSGSPDSVDFLSIVTSFPPFEILSDVQTARAGRLYRINLAI
jgi:hypothetical protein